MRSSLLLTLRVATSVVLLALVFSWLEPDAVVERLLGLEVRWVLPALALSVLQVLGSAWRWRFTAQRLGLDLPLPKAVSEYYLATFLNQTLPGGVLGDVSRAWRHARVVPLTDPDLAPAAVNVRSSSRTRSVHAVILERASGLTVMSCVAALSALMLIRRASPAFEATTLIALVGIAGSCALVAYVFSRWSRRGSRAALLLADAHRALLAGRALPIQLATSLAVVASYLLVFLMAARAVGIDTPATLLLPLMAVVLMAMLVPVSFAGWGVRELAAATLWGSVGLAATDGAAASVAYGVIVLLSSLPGIAPLLFTLWRDRGPGRRARLLPDGSAGPSVAAPDRGFRSPEG